MPSEQFGPLRAEGVRLAGHTLTISADRSGGVDVTGLPGGWCYTVE
jgi:hypothetical protein